MPVKRTINRKYQLTADEVKTAILFYLRESKDCPVPTNYDDAHLTWNGEHDIFITYDEEIDG